MATEATAVEPEAPIAPCIAGLRTALVDATVAVERWCDESPMAMADALDDGAKALARARRMAAEVRATIPAHSRRARLVLRAVDQVGEALRLIERARAWDWSDEDPGADVAMLASLRRALATAHRAVDAAEG